MTSRQRRVQTLYEISLAIETGESIEETADQALVAYLQKLNCSVGGVFEISAPSDGAEPTLVTSIPANPIRNDLCRPPEGSSGRSVDRWTRHRAERSNQRGHYRSLPHR